MNFDYLLFDLDNCLLNFTNPYEYFDNVLVETIKILTTSPLPNRLERNKFWSSGDSYKDVLKGFGIGELNKFWLHFDEADFKNRKYLVDKGELELYNDVKDVLKRFLNAGKKMAIISNAADYIVDFILKKFKIGNIFHATFGLGFDKDQALAKPSPNGILGVLDKLNYNPEKSNALMIGDSKVDVFAAKRANINACLIKRNINKYPEGFKNWDYQPDYVVLNLDEICNL